jgi:hypothetical protein
MTCPRSGVYGAAIESYTELKTVLLPFTDEMM